VDLSGFAELAKPEGKKVKVPSRAEAHRAALISVFVALSQTPDKSARPRTRGQCVAWCACLPPSFRWYQIIHTAW